MKRPRSLSRRLTSLSPSLVQKKSRDSSGLLMRTIVCRYLHGGFPLLLRMAVKRYPRLC